MYFQTPDSPNCGPTALRIAIRALGKRPPSEKRAARLCRTSKVDGTGPIKLAYAVRSLGYEVRYLEARDERSEYFSPPFYAAVREEIYDGHPVIVCVDNWEHWCCAIGLLKDRIILIDPSNDAPNNGISVLDEDEFTERARFKPTRHVTKPFFGLAVIRP